MYKSLLYLAIFLSLLSVVLYSHTNTIYSIRNHELLEKREQQELLKKEIGVLKLKVAEVSSMETIYERAINMGFVEYEKDLETY